jgi:predicted transglutaminase-like cysteine proteinase
MSLTPQRWRELQEINSTVNGSLRKVSDAERHGREEVWSLPTDGSGDCEDFALLKRRRLIERGWPSSALLLTMAKNWSGEGHAVLTVVTDQGDYILDSESSTIRPWNETGYQFVARQSQSNPRTWAVLGGNAAGR